jgi:hypothetical protein
VEPIDSISDSTNSSGRGRAHRTHHRSRSHRLDSDTESSADEDGDEQHHRRDDQQLQQHQQHEEEEVVCRSQPAAAPATASMRAEVLSIDTRAARNAAALSLLPESEPYSPVVPGDIDLELERNRSATSLADSKAGTGTDIIDRNGARDTSSGGSGGGSGNGSGGVDGDDDEEVARTSSVVPSQSTMIMSMSTVRAPSSASTTGPSPVPLAPRSEQDVATTSAGDSLESLAGTSQSALLALQSNRASVSTIERASFVHPPRTPETSACEDAPRAPPLSMPSRCSFASPRPIATFRKAPPLPIAPFAIVANTLALVSFVALLVSHLELR